MITEKQRYLLRAPVLLITGETGSGKSHIAQKIVEESDRWCDQFVTVHLAALSEALIESELFGHQKGAFTGAVQQKIGYFEKCKNGTLFLDEIGELSLESQKKLLYLLEERKFSPVGSTREMHFNGRIIAATHCDLKKLVEEGKFREDLYYRLMLAQLVILPLRESREQIESLLAEINQGMAKRYACPPMHIERAFREWCLDYSWPGNIRELKNLLEYYYLRGGKSIEVEELPAWIRERSREQSNSQAVFPLDYAKGLEIFEGTFFRQALEHFHGRINETARQIGISKSTLIAKIRKYGINTWEIRSRNFSSLQGLA